MMFYEFLFDLLVIVAIVGFFGWYKWATEKEIEDIDHGKKE